jgi:hypothetical protein
MWFLLYFQPYDDFSDNLISSVTQLQLFLTLWLGLMIQLNAMNEESLINQQFLSVLLVGTCMVVTLFGVGLIFRDGIVESRKMYTQDKQERTFRIQEQIRKRWLKAFHYVCYENQLKKFGRLDFNHLSSPILMDAIRRLKEENKAES